MNIVAMDALAKIEERLGLFYKDSKKHNNPNLFYINSEFITTL